MTKAPRAFSLPEVAFLIGAPLLWGMLLLFHPTGDGDEFYPIIRDQVTAWQVVHIGTLMCIPVLAGVVYLLLRGVDGFAALISRIALAAFAVFFTAFEVLNGIGLGILVDLVNELPAAERTGGAQLVEDFAGSSMINVFELIGSVAWLVAVVAAGVALFRRSDARSSVAVVLLLVVSAVPVTWHVPPFGQAGLALFIAAVVLVLRRRSTAPASARPDRRLRRPRPSSRATSWPFWWACRSSGRLCSCSIRAATSASSTSLSRTSSPHGWLSTSG